MAANTAAASKLRVYADTSVFGGVHDREFARPSSQFFERIREGRFLLVASALVEEEIRGAPSRVVEVYREMLRFADWADFADEAISLRHAYMEEGIVTRSSSADALHVALATINRCNILVSWNCRHIVHFQKIPLYNAVNVRLGFGVIAIHTPLEVISDEEEGV